MLNDTRRILSEADEGVAVFKQKSVKLKKLPESEDPGNAK